MIRAIEQEGLWVNRGFLPGRPMYAAGVRQNGSLVVLIGLYTASEEQMTLYYQNLFRILCGLVETALVRALSTRALCEKTGICRHLSAASGCVCGAAGYSLHPAGRQNGASSAAAGDGNVQKPGRIQRPGEALHPQYRCSSVGTNNAVYLLMNQTDEENLPLLTRRLDERGLHVTAVPLDEQLRLISAAKQEASHA